MALSSKVRQLLMGMGAYAQTTKGFDRVAKAVELLSFEEGKASFKMIVDESHLNRPGTLHGGMTATLVDTLTTIVVASKPPHKPGVSVDMSISYLRPAKPGQEIIINAEVVKLGKVLAFTAAELLHKDGKLIAKASHTKFIGEGMPSVITE